MTLLNIRDLPQMKELDKKAMSSTTGGYHLLLPIFRYRPIAPKTNNVNFGTGNSFVGNTAGVNEGSQSVGEINL